MLSLFKFNTNTQKEEKIEYYSKEKNKIIKILINEPTIYNLNATPKTIFENINDIKIIKNETTCKTQIKFEYVNNNNKKILIKKIKSDNFKINTTYYINDEEDIKNLKENGITRVESVEYVEYEE